MKTTKVFLLTMAVLFGVILTDGYTKTLISNNDNTEGPRRRIILVTKHCNVRPVIRYERRERREEFRERRENEERWEYRERRENEERREYGERRGNEDRRERDRR